MNRRPLPPSAAAAWRMAHAPEHAHERTTCLVTLVTLLMDAADDPAGFVNAVVDVIKPPDRATVAAALLSYAAQLRGRASLCETAATALDALGPDPTTPGGQS